MSPPLLLLVLLGCVSSQFHEYVDFLPGTLNIILSAPHGGDLEPGSIPDRDAGCFIDGECVWEHDCGTTDDNECGTSPVKDLLTQELTRELHDRMCAEFGACPSTVISLLHRRKHDPIHDVNRATFNVPEAVEAWNVYHGLLAEAKSNQTGPALVLDIHGHDLPNVQIQLGYLIPGPNLDNDTFTQEDTSIRGLASRVGGTFEDLLRGSVSYGHFLEANNRTSVPSPSNVGPEGEKYFSGGNSYITRTYGSRDGGLVDAIQMENPRDYREDYENFAVDITAAVRTFYDTHGYSAGFSKAKK